MRVFNDHYVRAKENGDNDRDSESYAFQGANAQVFDPSAATGAVMPAETSGWKWQTLPDNVVREPEPDEAESAIVEMKRLGTFQRRLA